MNSLLHVSPTRRLVVTCLLAVAAPASGSEVPTLRLDEVLWREVRNRQNETLGSISDVLVQMPSGRVVFVAVDPAELFERPKVVPPGALKLPAKAEGALQLDVAWDRWITAPRLDWNAELVIKNTEEGNEIYGFYQQTWQEPDSTPPWGMTVVAEPEAGQPPVRYVSLKNLLLEQVVTHAGELTGYVRDFLLDWPAKRATHALVSPQFVPKTQPERMWFAVPTPLLNPPSEQDALTVNSNAEAFRNAAPMPTGRASAGGALVIHQYPAPAK